MDKLPLVSIIIPTFNDSTVVCEAIDCSLNQTYENIEIIVVDDGSTDGTGKLLINRYGSKIKYIFQENKGLASARNTGIRHSTGKYLQFLDADDLIDSKKISIQVSRLKEIPGMALSYCDYIRCTTDNITELTARTSPVLNDENPFYDVILKWETELSIPIHCFLFDTSLFKEFKISFDEKLPNHEDWDCWVKVFALKPKVIFIDRPLAYYRIRGNSMCSNRLKMRKGYLMAINKQIRLERNNIDVVNWLNMKKREIRYIYRDVGLAMRIVERCHPYIKKIYSKLVPWRVQRMLD